MTKTLVVMIFAAIVGVIGDLLLSRGMKDLGDVSALNMRGVIPFIGKLLGCPRIWLGTFFLALFFILWLSVLSWAELSVALPLQAITFILTPLIAQLFQGESTSAIRWAGTILISIGTVLVTLKH